MRDTVSRGLDLLAGGLRPYITRQASVLHCDERTQTAIHDGDVQFLLVFMWDRWNDIFRHELTFADRSIISELREFRNRWAHQERFTDSDTYRVMDNIYRLLNAVKSDRATEASSLRQESLNKLWVSEFGSTAKASALESAWPYLLCLASAFAISFALLRYVNSPWGGLLTVLVNVAMLRLAWRQSKHESVRAVGPRECLECGRIIYNLDCPYCHPESVNPGSDADDSSRRAVAVLPGKLRLVKAVKEDITAQ